MQVNKLHELDLDRLRFVGESLSLLRKETQGQVDDEALLPVSQISLMHVHVGCLPAALLDT